MTLSSWLHAPGHNHYHATISLSFCASVPSRNQEIVPPSLTLQPATPFHRATCHQHAATVLPWDLVRLRSTSVPPCHQRATWCTTVIPCHLVRHRATQCATVPLSPPLWHRAAVPPPYLHDTSAYPCTLTHLIAVNHSIWYCLTQFHYMVRC